MTADQDLEQSLRELVTRPDFHPMKPRLIAKRLRLSEARQKDLKRLLKKLVKSGELVYGANHLISVPAKRAPRAAAERFSGVFRRAAGGYGFVRPDSDTVARGHTEDVYIPQQDTADAATGDVVLVVLEKRKRGGRGPRGAITEVLERESHEFVGTYFESAGRGMVQVDGALFAQAISVGDPGAKGARPNDKVVLEMVRFPSHTHDGEGVITEVLGPRGGPGVDTLSIIREYRLPQEFADDALAAARKEAEKFDESIGSHRTDFTGETVITIDPVDARDFDDAISLARHDNGHWMLGVHIADVSHFVQTGNPLDREAHQRGTSVYLPDRVIPMLPEVISNGLASLQPDRVRYTKTAVIEFTGDGARVAVDLHSAAIRSCRRFTYEEVDDFLEHRAAWRKKLSPEVYSLLERMHELAMILRDRRMRRGSLELSLDEVKVDLDDDGRVKGAHRVEHTVSHQMIEEFMLAANEAVADRLAEAGLAFLRRVHMSPDPRKAKALTEFVAELGIKTSSLESRFELQKLLATVHDRPERQAVNYAVLRSLPQATYGPQDEGHFALASDCYCHFTSPIRRYPDLTIHRLIDSLLARRKVKTDHEALAALGQHCSDRERRAEAAERELKKVKLLDYLSARIGLEMDAVITGVEEYGLFAQGVDLPADGLIHVTSLADDYYTFDRRSHSITGRRAGNAYRLGDRVRVAVARVDLDRRELDFRIVGREPRGKAHPAKAAPLARGKAIERGGRGKKASDRKSNRGSKPHKRKKERRSKRR